MLQLICVPIIWFVGNGKKKLNNWMHLVHHKQCSDKNRVDYFILFPLMTHIVNQTTVCGCISTMYFVLIKTCKIIDYTITCTCPIKITTACKFDTHNGVHF